MANQQILTQLENAKAYYKTNKRFFRKFFRYYTIVNCKVSTAIKGISVIMFLGSILIAGLGLFGVIDSLQGNLYKYMLITFLISFVMIGILGCLEDIQDAMYQKYDVVTIVGNMASYMCGLNYVFWNMKDIKKIIKKVSAGKAKDFQSLVLEIRPKCKQWQFDVDAFNEISRDAIARQNKKIKAENKKIEKAEMKKLKQDIFWGAVSDAVLSNVTGGSGAKLSGPTYESVPRTAPVNSSDDSKKRAAEERQRQLADYAKQADYWEREYRRLYAWDPNHYKTKDAEYNKNYFRRLSKGGS